MIRLRAFQKRSVIEQSKYKERLLDGIRKNFNKIAKGECNQVSFEETYRLVYNFVYYCCMPSKNFKNILDICDILDHTSVTTKEDLNCIKDVLLYVLNIENKYGPHNGVYDEGVKPF